MTNKERQASLDKKKWIASEKKGEDMSGKMLYCNFCKYKYYKLSMCTVTQEEREGKCLCSTAYNRMQRD